MPSNIISTTIDETYPVAGVDNDSQGFRDNFTIIKDNFTYAKDEIEDLQDTAARITTDNAFGYNVQSNMFIQANVAAKSQTEINGATPSPTISFSNASFYEVTVSQTGTLNINGWQDIADKTHYAEIILALSADTSTSGYVVTFASTNAGGSPSTIFVDDSGDFSGATVTMPDASDDYILVKAKTWDSGVRVFLESLGTYTETV